MFWKLLPKTEVKDGEKADTVPMLRYYHVFNVEQTEGVAYPQQADTPSFPHDPIAEAEKIAAAMPQQPTVTHADESRAFYRAADDLVNVPPLSR